MNGSLNVTDSELPRLKQLASDLLAVEHPEVSALDQIAALAAEIAGRGRDTARRQLLDQVSENALAIFTAAPSDLHARLAQSSLDELSSLGTLLDDAVAAGTAFLQADAGLLAARERGDYAAMAPLAIEADGKRKALANASGEFAKRLGLGDGLTPAALMAKPPAPPIVEATAEDSPLTEPTADGLAGLAAEAPEAQPERRRLRALLRQMRPVSEAQ